MAGDTLAKGGIRAQFPATGKRITQAEWDKIWEDDGGAVNSSDTDKESTGIPSTDAGEVEPNRG